MTTCTVEGCGQRVRSRGLCRKHLHAESYLDPDFRRQEADRQSARKQAERELLAAVAGPKSLPKEVSDATKARRSASNAKSAERYRTDPAFRQACAERSRVYRAKRAARLEAARAVVAAVGAVESYVLGLFGADGEAK